MARGPTTFRQRDATALIKAARAAGCDVLRVEVGKDGRIIVVTAGSDVATLPSPEEAREANEWDRD